MMVLTAFRSHVDEQLTLTQISRTTGLPKPTVHRLLAELEPWDVIERTPTGIRLGAGLAGLGELPTAQRRLRTHAEPVLAELSDRTGHTAHVAVLDGADIVYVGKRTGSHAPLVETRIGGHMPAHSTALGKALLAFSPREHIESVVTTHLFRCTPRTVVAPGLLMREFRRARDVGITEEHEESVTGIACVAAPVFRAGGELVASVSVTGRAGRLRREHSASAVRSASREIGRLLGPSGRSTPRS